MISYAESKVKEEVIPPHAIKRKKESVAQQVPRRKAKHVELVYPNYTVPLATQLEEKGFGVVRVHRATLDALDVQTFLSQQVEYLPGTRQKVLGGFGAYGNPSSYHHPQVRRFRHAVWGQMREMLGEVFPGRYLQCLPDRFCVRLKDKPVTAEAWHRDVSLPYDNPRLVAVYGGWVNLDVDTQVTQYFSCVPGSHRDTIPTHLAGFETASDETKVRCETEKQLVVVPPGHALLFNERLLHEIAKRPQDVDASFRQYCKYVLSTEPLDVFGAEEVDRCLDTLASFPLHETFDEKGQRKLEYPPLYAKSHVMFHQGLLKDFSATLLPPFCHPYKEKDGTVVVRAARFPVSLQQAALDHAFAPYTPDERAWYRPFLLGQ